MNPVYFLNIPTVAKPKSIPEAEPISPELTAQMTYLQRLFSPGQCQIHFDELLQRCPPKMTEAERRFRLEALKALGYRDLRTDKEKQEQKERDDERTSILRLEKRIKSQRQAA